MKKANILTSIISFFSARPFMKAAMVFIAGAVFGLVAVQFVPVHIDVQMRTKEKGFLQYYVDTGSGFDEMQSKRVQLSESPDFSHYAISIRASGIRKIRIDPLETQGQFELLGLQIDYLFWHRQWLGHSELKYLLPTHDIEVKSTEGAVLSGHATGNEPILVTADVKYLERWQRAAAIFFALLGGAVALLLFSGAKKHFGGLNVVLAHRHTPLIAIAIAATLLRLIYWQDSSLPSDPNLLQTTWSDEGTYSSIAKYIITHGFWDYFFAEQSVLVAPGTPVYLALMYTVINSIDAIRAINLLISVLSIVLVYKLGERLFSKPIGLLSAGMCAVHGQLIEYSAMLISEPLFLCFFIAGIYFLVRALEAALDAPGYRYQKYALSAALFLTLAILTRSIAMLLPVFLLATIGGQEAYRSWRVGQPSFPLLKRAALPLFLPLFIVGIVAAKNWVVLDRFIVATGSGAALWLGSRADTEGDEPPLRGLKYDTPAIEPGIRHLSIRGDRLLMEAAKKNIHENPLGYAWWNVKKIGRLMVGSNLAWFNPHKNMADWYRASGRSAKATTKMLFQIILASSIAVYGIIGLVTIRGQQSSGIAIPATACYLVLFSIPFLAIQRYGLPLVMLLTIPASAVIYGAWHAVGRLRRVALLGAPLVLAIVVQIILAR